MKNLKTLFVSLVIAGVTKDDVMADIRAQKPWTKPASVKAELDGAMVRALAAHYGFNYGATDDSKAGPSGLAIKSPGKDMDAATKRRYGAARKRLSKARQLFNKPAEKTAASLTDKLHREAKVLAGFTDAQFKRIAELRKAYIAKQ